MTIKNDKNLKLAVMQPYFFPYLGYFQVMNAVDKYVVYDDVNYIKGGRINRNEILSNGKAQRINLLLDQASPNKKINEIELLDNNMATVSKEKFFKTICLSYAKAPYFKETYALIEDIMNYTEKNLALFLFNSFKKICAYLGITTELILSSNIDKDSSLKKEQKLFQICEILGAKEYYNSINGQALYTHKEFEDHGLQLHFLKMDENIEYKQLNHEFVPYLSIIDVMMFNSVENIQKLLLRYTLS